MRDSFDNLIVYKDHTSLYRIRDQKLLAEFIYYGRGSGDPISYLHPSSYSCPSTNEFDFTKKIFLIEKN